MSKVMLKVYEDERINAILKQCLLKAVNDEEYYMRYDFQGGMEDFSILMDDIDKVLEYVKNDCKGELRINRNIWYICQDALFDILDLYDLDLEEEYKVSESSLVIPKGQQLKANDLNGKYISLYELFMFIVGRYTNDEILELSKDLKEYVDEDV